MSGGSVGYHDRPNKAIDRIVWLELVGALFDLDEDEDVYVTLGGPQLVDPIMLHKLYGCLNIISIEQDETTYNRQLFNVRPKDIDCRSMSSAQLVDDFDLIAHPSKSQTTAVWLDYANSRQRLNQIEEFCILLQKLFLGDVVKITMNANPSTLKNFQGVIEPKLSEKRISVLKSQLGEHVTFLRPGTKLSPEGLALVLQKALLLAGKATLKTSGLHLECINSFRYSDGTHSMLTATFMLQRSPEKSVAKIVELRSRGVYLNDGDLELIDLPALTIREQIEIERHISRGTVDMSKVPFAVNSDKEKSNASLLQYAKFYRKMVSNIPL